MSENSISDGFIHVLPDKRDQGDPLPLTPGSYNPEDVYMRMDSIATATYPNELAPSSGVQNQPQPQVYRNDAEYNDNNQRYNPQTSSPAKTPGEYRPLHNEGDVFRTQSYIQRDGAPSYAEPYTANPPYPPNPLYPPYPDNSASTGHHSQNPYDRETGPNNYSVRDRIPSDPYGRDHCPNNTYSTASNPNDAYGTAPNPGNRYGRPSDSGNPYSRQQGTNIPSARDTVPSNPYCRDSNLGNTYEKQPEPNDPYARDPNPDGGYGKKPAPTYGGDPYLKDAYARELNPNNSYTQQADLSNAYARDSNFSSTYNREPDPQYAQVRKHSATTAYSTPHRSKSSFDSQEICPTPQTRFDTPQFNIRLPKPNELPAPNFPGAGADLPPPRHRFPNNDLPSPHFPQPATPRFPPDSYPPTGYNPRPGAPYGGGYTHHESHTVSRPQLRQTFSEVRNTDYSELQHMGNEAYGAGYNLPRPHPTNLPAPNIKRNPATNNPSPRDSYYNQGQPPACYPYRHPNPQFQGARIYEAIGDVPYSPASGHTMCDPNGLPAPRHQGEDRDVHLSPSAMPKPKIPPVNTQRSRTMCNGQRSNRDSRFDVNQGLEVLRIVPVRATTPPPPGWECPACTYRNKPPRPGCEICAAARPEDYIVPVEYEMDEDEMVRQKRAEEHEIQVQEDRLLEREKNYQAMIQAADQDLIEVDEIFECPICIMDTDVGDGVRLRECLHAFCRDCLSMHIVHAEDAEVKCPYQGETYQCQSVVTEREVKQLLSPDQFRHWQQMGLNQAEGTIQNAFHCKSADCTGWCVYEDEVNFFNCPVCNVQNCLTCKAIHEGKNCKEYQADIVNKAQNDDDAKRTQKMLEDMIKEGEAMKCPKCDVIIQKKLGCDWIRCTVCKTEICWATKGFRWGPKGKGDTSGGCKCRADGQNPCSPQCHNCH